MSSVKNNVGSYGSDNKRKQVIVMLEQMNDSSSSYWWRLIEADLQAPWVRGVFLGNICLKPNVSQCGMRVLSLASNKRLLKRTLSS